MSEYISRLPAIGLSLLIGILGAVGISQVAAGQGEVVQEDTVSIGEQYYEVVPLDGTRSPGVYFEPDGSVIATEQIPCAQPDGSMKLIPVEDVLGPFEPSGDPMPEPGSLSEEEIEELNRNALAVEPICAPPDADVELRVVEE